MLDGDLDVDCRGAEGMMELVMSHIGDAKLPVVAMQPDDDLQPSRFLI
jgi:hypothetical protein